MLLVEGRCHCGAIGFTFEASQPPERWAVRACQYSFCRAHGARTVSDPRGEVTFQLADASKLGRYRFGLRTADLLVCRTCGVYLAAVLTSGNRQFATVNINTLTTALAAPEPQPVSYDGETAEQRRLRREQRWTPVARAI